MPGYLIPADLDRLIPRNTDPYRWAHDHLLASAGALVVDTLKGQSFRIHTLVPATKADGSCINLTDNGLCTIHATAPFGCAFFSCTSDNAGLSKLGLIAIIESGLNGLYNRLWNYLDVLGKRSLPLETSRTRLRIALEAMHVG